MLVRTDGSSKNQALRMCPGGPGLGVTGSVAVLVASACTVEQQQFEVLQIAFLIEAQHTCWGVELVKGAGPSATFGRIVSPASLMRTSAMICTAA